MRAASPGSLILILAAFFVVLPASGQPVTREDAAAIRAAISEQLDAFKADDAPRAFALATADIRAHFGSADVFMSMVRSSYPVVYRPHGVQFEAPEVIDGDVFQPVRMTDADGRAWIAIYPMQRQPDGSWRINGCQLGRLQGREI